MKRTQYRQLRPGEDPPPGEPKRYTSDKRGYVRLRWKVGPASYVETYEHRLVAGVPDADVHHENEDKRDNAPSNLHRMSRADHAREHGQRARAASKSVNLWGGLNSQEAYDKRQRRLARERARQAFRLEVARLYRQGLSTTEIAERVKRDSSVISRVLRQAGVVPRPRPTRRKPANEIPDANRQLVHARSGMRCERCGHNLLWETGHVHHRQTRATRVHTPDNLLHLCTGCHGWVHAHPALARDDGWIVSKYIRPDELETVPCLHHRLGRVFYKRDGTISSGE